MSEERQPSNRIALFLPSIGYGGAERVTINLAEGLVAKGYDIDLVYVTSDDPPLITDIPAGVNLVDLDAGRVVASLPGLIRYLRRVRPIALLSALEHTNIIALLAAKLAGTGTRVVVSVHTTLSRAVQDSPLLRARLFPYLIRRLYPWAARVVAVSEAARDDLLATTGLHPDSVRVILNPVVTPSLFRKGAEPLSHPWLSTGEAPVILAVGRMVTAKNFELLIRAFARLRKQMPARLIILGEGELLPRLQSLTQRLEVAADVQMPGFTENPYAYMARADLFVLSSNFEGLPTVLIEALALGTPVVATDCPSGPREILGGGRYGILTPTGDEHALANGMFQALNNPVADTEAVEKSWQPYELGRVTTEYLSLLLGHPAVAEQG